MIVRIGTYTLDVPPSLLVWLTLALLLMLGLAFAGKRSRVLILGMRRAAPCCGRCSLMPSAASCAGNRWRQAAMLFLPRSS